MPQGHRQAAEQAVQRPGQLRAERLLVPGLGRAGDRQATVHGDDPSAAGTRGRHLDRQQRAKRVPDQHRMLQFQGVQHRLQVGGEASGA
jgi:hypothetical protein